jgi:poly-gamma-glutamate synthesis protein (capsule biosynthesis protein)
MKLMAAGDLWLTGAKVEFQVAGGGRPGVFLANLETPTPAPGTALRPKAGPAIAGDAKSLDPAANLGAQVCLTLANNHMMDFGWPGVDRTLAECRRRQILTVGAGQTLAEAGQPVIIEQHGLRVGVLGCCETQFGIATPHRGGVQALDPGIHRAIRQLRAATDFVVVSVHAAAEMSPWPSPKWQDFCRSLIEAGAGLVHGHHAHVPQGYERYGGGVISYGLGNFCVDPARWQSHPNGLWSVVLELALAPGREPELKVDTLIVEAQPGSIRVRRANAAEGAMHQAYLQNCNQPLADRQALTALWQEVALRLYACHYAEWLGFHPPRPAPGQGWLAALRRWRQRLSRSLRAARRTLAPRPSSPGQLLLWYHLVACESHSDALATALGVLSGELPDLRTAATRSLVDAMMPESKETVAA